MEVERFQTKWNDHFACTQNATVHPASLPAPCTISPAQPWGLIVTYRNMLSTTFSGIEHLKETFQSSSGTVDPGKVLGISVLFEVHAAMGGQSEPPCSHVLSGLHLPMLLSLRWALSAGGH